MGELVRWPGINAPFCDAALNLKTDRCFTPGRVITHNQSDTGDDRRRLRLGEKIDLNLDLCANGVTMVNPQQHARYAEVNDLPRLPGQFANRPHACGPFDAMPTCVALVLA